MTEQIFVKKTEYSKLNNFLLSELDIIKNEYVFIEIDLHPDYDKSNFEKGISKTYYFENTWNFKNEYDSIIEAKIIDSFAYDIETINELKSQHNISNKYLSENIYADVLREASSIDEYSFNGDALDNWNDFKINPIRIIDVNNTTGEIKYNGSFFGELPYIDSAEFEVVSKIQIKGYKKNIKFFKQILAESKILLSEKKYKLSYFLTYSSLENYINNELNSESSEERLEDKLKRLCKMSLGDLNKNQIYSSIISKFKKFTLNRNIIAHGKEEINITDEDLYDFFNFVLTIIYINKNKVTNFKEIYERYTNANNG